MKAYAAPTMHPMQERALRANRGRSPLLQLTVRRGVPAPVEHQRKSPA
ncbi:hypothetical protein SAMN05216577_103243 [Pseudomonas citronellolis]|uniref:Uncharacterized protein n=1 Tax=Pseudomonas citronellolis TaxID=53408 RepID=A0AAQ1HJW9_9PSED|nr:hypothetical protein [Pseudomonas citronellolis]MCP1656942.1 hypothetical protein [Pseudomonas citronellolis]MCP1723868.1 hypothetical protein [Pseudomonas citronellolis]SFC20068.1 hypothetical protein SAMN05216577_103243 [Pseudomonas citronellolis]